MKSTVRGLALVVAIVLCGTSLNLSAQAPQKVYRIGWLGYSTPALNEGLIDAFRQGLRSYGWIDSQNVALEFRWPGQIHRMMRSVTGSPRPRAAAAVAAA